MFIIKNNAFKIGSIYIGAIIGAGFASGKEMLKFFTVYGIKGIYGIVLASILFILLSSFVLLKIYRYKYNSYNDWLYKSFGSNMGSVVEFILSLFLIIGYCVMLAGSGVLFKEYFGYSEETGIIIMSIITCITFIFSIDGLAFLNSIIVPLLFIGILSMGGWITFNSDFVISNEVGVNINFITGNWVTSSLLYVSYNGIGAIMVLSSLYPLLNNEKEAIKGSLIGGLGLGIISVFLLIPTLIFYTDIKGVEIPMMAIANKFGNLIMLLYAGLLWLAMLTTATCNGFTLINNLEKKINFNRSMICILFCLLTMPLSKFGFKELINLFYPMFGYIGIIIMALIIFKEFNVKSI